MKMVVCDTIAFNTGRYNGVKIQKKFEMVLVAPKYIGCQHHILEGRWRHILVFLFKKLHLWSKSRL